MYTNIIYLYCTLKMEKKEKKKNKQHSKLI